MKRYVYRCVRCGVVFDAPSPAMHLLWSGQFVEHCEQRATVIHVEEQKPQAVNASPGGEGGTPPASTR